MNTKEIKNLAANSQDTICFPETGQPRVVVVGGGFAGLALVDKLKNQPVQVVLIDKNNFHQFQPLFYQVATSGLEPDSIVFPFRKQISRQKNVIFRLAEVQEIQTEKNVVVTNKGKVPYDFLVLATGTATNFFGMEEVQRHGLGMKSIRDSLNIRHMMLQNLEQAAITCNEEEREALADFVIVGGGPAGVEMSGALAEFRKYILPKDYPEYPASIMNIYLIEAQDKLLPAMSLNASRKTRKYLNKLNINVLLNEVVTGYDGQMVKTKSGKEITARNLIWTAGVKGNLPKGINDRFVVRGNRLAVDKSLKVKGLDNVYAIGDMAALVTEEYPAGHPQVAQVAIQMGRFVGHTLIQVLLKKPASAFRYQDKGSLATIGRRKAVADLGKFQFGGYFAWLLWSLVHLMSISGFRNKILVAINWAVSYFSYEKSNRLIIRNFKTK